MIAVAVENALKDEGYSVDRVNDGAAAHAALACPGYVLVLLDLGLPKVDGMEVLKSLRRRGDMVPVLVMTARDTVDDRIQGLDFGADDYLVKPFATGELLARMRALLRRSAGSASPRIGTDALSLDPETRCATAGDNITALSPREFALLHALLMRPGAILSRGELEDRIYGWGQEVESNAVEFLIHSLRKKLGREAIHNVRGVGWTVTRR